VLTCDGVIVEAQHLLRRAGLSAASLLDLLEGGALVPVRTADSAVGRTAALARKYLDLPMAWTDACLVHLSEMYPRAVICTFDSDFETYRRFGSERLPLAMP
jgi:predicted nucleic acid-binding protein